MSRYTSFHIVCYQKCRYFFINKKKIGSKKLPAAAGSPAGHRAGFKQCSDALQFFIQLLTWVDKKCIKRLKPENRKKVHINNMYTLHIFI